MSFLITFYLIISAIVMIFLFLVIENEVEYCKKRNYLTAFIASLLFPIFILLAIVILIFKRKEKNG
jgi:lipopolysaccharide export LptBFGC system permease protein LptF